MTEESPQSDSNPPHTIGALEAPMVHALLSAAGFYLGVLDLEGRHLMTNGVVAESEHFSHDRVIGVRIEDTYWWNFSEESRLRVREDFERAAHGERVSRQTFGRVAEGVMVHVEYVLAPLQDPATGTPIGVIFSGVDVNRLVEAERLASESSARIHQLIESNPIGVASGMLDGTVKECNQAFLDILGVTREEVKRGEVNWILRSPEEERDLVIKRFAEALQVGRMGPFEKRFLRPDGSTVSALVGAAMVWGEPPMGTAFVLDLTDRKEAEQRLQRSEAQFRLLAEAVPHLVWTSATDGRIDYMNSQWEAYTGLVRSEIEAGSWDLIIHEEDRPEVHRRWLEARTHLTPYEAEYRIRRHDGEFRWHLARASFEEDLDGARWVGTCTDIHEQKQQQEVIRLSGERFRSLVESLPGYTWTTDHLGVTTWVSPSFGDYIGASTNQDDISSACHPEDLEQLYAGWSRCLTTGDPLTTEMRIRRADGEYRWFLVKCRAIRAADGTITEWVGVSTEIHLQKVYEEELQQEVQARTAELIAMNDEMASFTYSISHDLRSPLRAIAANATLLNEEVDPGIGVEAQHRIHRLGENAKKLGVLIDDLLQLSRIGRDAMEHLPVDLTALALDVIEGLEAGRTDKWTFVLQPDLEAIGDARYLRLALTNLLENAVKFSPSGGEIVFGQSGGVFFVSDQGVGFDPQFAERIFRPFERLVTDREFPGTGIGLTNVQRIIERHGGKVWAESEPGRGATVFFRIP